MALRLTLVAVLALASISCGRQAVTVQQTGVLYTQTNLRARSNGAMTSINRWRGTEVVPVCTPVTIGTANARRVNFEANGRRYSYTLYRGTRLGIDEHVQRLFGPGCPDLSTYAPSVAAAIQAGQPAIGMTRNDVILALGYPPDHRTPALSDLTWTYWGARGTFTVTFAGDHVSAVNGRDFEGDGVSVVSVAAAPAQTGLIVVVETGSPGAAEVPLDDVPPPPAPAAGTAGAPCSQPTHCHAGLGCHIGPGAQQGVCQ